MATTTKENTKNFTIPVLYGVFQSHFLQLWPFFNHFSSFFLLFLINLFINISQWQPQQNKTPWTSQYPFFMEFSKVTFPVFVSSSKCGAPCRVLLFGNGKKHRFNRFYTLSDEYRWYEHLSSLLSYPHLVSYHRNAMHLHLQFIRSLFCTSFFPYNFLLFSHGISFFFNYLSVSFPFIIQFIVIYCLLDIHLSSPLTATTRNQTTTLTVLCTSLWNHHPFITYIYFTIYPILFQFYLTLSFLPISIILFYITKKNDLVWESL